MKAFTRLILFTGCVSTVMFCGCATPYQKMGLTGGFRDKQLEPGVYSVLFAGNGYINPNTVSKYMLYRTAEITVENGYDYFAFIMDRGRTDVTWTYVGNGISVAVPKPSSEGIFRVFKGEKPGNYPDAIKAQEVIDKLKPEIEKPRRDHSVPTKAK